MLRLIQPDELSAHIQQQATTKFGAASTNHKHKKVTRRSTFTSVSPIQVDPETLELLPELLVDNFEKLVEQTPFAAVAADGRGIAICNSIMATPFLQAAHSLSPNALALLLTNLPAEDFPSQRQIEKLSFPAKYIATGEPIIIIGALVQLGDLPVRRVQAAGQPKLEAQNSGLPQQQPSRLEAIHCLPCARPSSAQPRTVARRVLTRAAQ